MTNIKSRGFDSDSTDQLNDHLLERESRSEDSTARSAEAEITALRNEVAELRERLRHIREQTEGVGYRQETLGERHPWLRIAAMTAATFVLGRVVQRLRLGAPGAAAVPMIAAQFDRRLW